MWVAVGLAGALLVGCGDGITKDAGPIDSSAACTSGICYMLEQQWLSLTENLKNCSLDSDCFIAEEPRNCCDTRQPDCGDAVNEDAYAGSEAEAIARQFDDCGCDSGVSGCSRVNEFACEQGRCVINEWENCFPLPEPDAGTSVDGGSPDGG